MSCREIYDLGILFRPLCFRLLPIAFRLQQLAGNRCFLLCNWLLAFLLMRWRRFLNWRLRGCLFGRIAYLLPLIICRLRF